MRRIIAGLVIMYFLFIPVDKVAAVIIESERENLKPENIYYPEEIEAEFRKELEHIIQELIDVGFKKEFLNDLKIIIYPSIDVRVRIGGEPVLVSAFVSYKTGEPVIRITMGQMDNITPVLLHELGHVVESKIFGIKGRAGWTNTGLIGRVYMDLRGYNEELDHDAQVILPWHNRISEWWAEDCKTELYNAINPEYKKFKKDFKRNEIELKPIKEVELLLKYLLFEPESKILKLSREAGKDMRD